MIISHKHKFIFIHIGKTGGTSVEKVLCERLDIDFEDTKKNPRNGHWWKHAWAREVRDLFGSEIWEEYFTFAFVRNPYDMLLSLYSMYTQYPEYINKEEHPKLYHPWNQFDDFKDLVISMRDKKHAPDEEWRLQLDKLGADNHMQVWNSLRNLQTKYLCNKHGDIMVDFVGRFENLQYDFDYCCKRIGIEPIDLIWHGPTKHKNYRDVYTSDMIDVVNNHSWKDIRKYGYERSIAK